MAETFDEARNVDEIRTAIGRFGWGDNHLAGYAVAGDLAGSTSVWSLMSLVFGHRKLTDAESSMLDDLAASSALADPRIWPLKAGRIAASWGNPTAGFAASVLAATGVAGPGTSRLCAQMLLDLRSRLSAAEGVSLPTAVGELLERNPRLPGFGVPLRPADERVLAFQQCVRVRQWPVGTYQLLVYDVEAELSRRRKTAVNIGGLGIAVLLDLGFAADTAAVMMMLIIQPSFIGNAVEGAAQQAPVLRSLPHSALRYRGVAPRTSPRHRDAERDDRTFRG
ncbi:hypothetical protein ACIQCJ_19055 [Streptomyces sp. NPDC093221]|uniref:hypothetical protein n=1 Tax=Streptomyces sp. NPDC093221 TaxID=3366032 RepID=UPI0037FF9A64